MDANLLVLSLEYTYALSSRPCLFESTPELWQPHLEWSKTLIPYHLIDQNASHVRIMDNLSVLRKTVECLNYNGVSDSNHIKLLEPQLQHQLITLSVSGNENFINNSRTEILSAYRKISHKSISISKRELELASARFTQRLSNIAAKYEVNIMITDYETDFHGHCVKSDSFFVCLVGTTDNVNLAETDTRILIEASLRDHFVERVLVPLSSVPCLGGANLANFGEITLELEAKIFVPYIMPSLSRSDHLKDYGRINIWTSLPSAADASLTKSTLSEFVGAASSLSGSAQFHIQELDIPRDKADLIALHHQTEILDIMLRNGTFIQLPLLGETRNCQVIIQGQSKKSVEDSAAEICILTWGLYRLQLKFSNGPFNTDLEFFLIDLVSLKKSCVLTYNGNGMHILGHKFEIQALLEDLVSGAKADFFFSKLAHQTTQNLKFELVMELANEQRDFLSGKKNGKVIKILNQMNQVPTIEFEQLSSFNFAIRLGVAVSGEYDPRKIVTAIQILNRTVKLIELEMPAELQFNIPELFHRSIIGNGGSIIQSIMKKYNVFIKFSRAMNSLNSPQKIDADNEKILYLFKRENNVLIRCPLKNLKNIQYVKYEIDQMVSQCCQNNVLNIGGMSVVYNDVKFKLLRSHYLLLTRKMDYNMLFVRELETEFGTFIDYPTSLDAFHGSNHIMLSIKGNDCRARMCAEKLAQLLPDSEEIRIEANPRFADTLTAKRHGFRESVCVPLRGLLDTETSVYPPSSESVYDRTYQVILSSFSRTQLRKAVGEVRQYAQDSGFRVSSFNSLHFDPIIVVNEVSSPLRLPVKLAGHLLGKSMLRSPLKSPQKLSRPSSGGKNVNVQEGNLLRRNSGRQDHGPLNVITNQNTLRTKLPSLHTDALQMT